MSATAKLFMHGRSQAVRLPKEFRFEGTEVRVSKVGDKVILEPAEKRPFDAAAWRAMNTATFRSWRTAAIKAPLSMMMTRQPWCDLHRYQCRNRSAQRPAPASGRPSRRGTDTRPCRPAGAIAA